MRSTATLLMLLVCAGCDTAARTAVAREVAPHNITRSSVTRIGDIRVVVESPNDGLLEVAPADMAAAIRNGYQLVPDRRFLYAVADLHRMLTGSPAKDLLVVRTNQGWRIRYGQDAVGELSLYPGYREATALLARWAQQLTQTTAVSSVELPADLAQRIELAYADLRSPDVTSALRALDAHWRGGSRSHAGINAAARLVTLLELQAFDDIGMTDVLTGHATALHVLARAVARPAPQDEVLHAFMMGYAAEADSMAAGLPANDVVRSYVRGDTAVLRMLADRKDASHLSEYLYLLRAAEAEDMKQWARALSGRSLANELSLAVLKPALSMRTYEGDQFLPAFVPAAALAEIWVFGGAPDITPAMREHLLAQTNWWMALRQLPVALATMDVRAGSILKRFEEDLRRTSATLSGPFLDGQTYATFLRGYMYSAYHTLALHRLDAEGAAFLADDVLQGLTNALPGHGSQLQRWLSNITAAEAGDVDLDALASDIGNLPLLGHASRARTYEAVVDHADYANPVVVAAARQYATQLDTRPAHLNAMAQAARNELHDPRLAVRLYRRSTELLGREDAGTSLWLRWLEGNSQAAATAIHQRLGSPDDRMFVLQRLIEDSLVAHDTAVSLFKELYDESGRTYNIAREHIAYLEKRQDYRGALQVAQEWIANGRRVTVFDSINAFNSVARMHYQLGEYKTARDVILKVVSFYQAGSLGRAALIFQALNDGARARDFGARLVERYPNNAWGRRVYASVLWQQRFYEQVPSVLNAPGFPISAWDWRLQIGPGYVEAFAQASIVEALAAVKPLVDAGVPPVAIEELSMAMHKAGRNDIAFAIQSSLRTSSQVGTIEIAVRGYRYLKTNQGETEALEWLRTQPALKMPLGMVSAVAYREAEWPLLWQLIDDPGKHDHGDFIWLMRAAAYARQEGKDPHRAALLAYYRKAGNGKYDVAGKHLMGLATLDEMMRHATDLNSRCELAYYAGLRAEADKRYDEAVVWYRAARETGAQHMGEYIFAGDALNQYNAARKRHLLLSSAR